MDCILVMGSNMAENHPIAFRFALQAKERAATLIHVDPRFTRTSALCDIYAPLRPGSDIAFLGGIIRYILEHNLWFKEYALAFSNLSTIIDERFKDTSELGGFFSGWDEESRSYKYDSWQYQGEVVPASLAEHHVNTTESFAEKDQADGKGAAAPRSDIAASALRLPDPAPPLRRLRARHGGAHYPAARATCSSKSPKHWRAIRAANARAPFATPSGGPIIRPASR